MDLLCRFNEQMESARRARAHLARLGRHLEPEPPSPRVAALFNEFLELDGVLTDRARHVVAGMDHLEATGYGAEEVELDIELIAHLERKVRDVIALLASEVEAPSKGCIACYEEPLG